MLKRSATGLLGLLCVLSFTGIASAAILQVDDDNVECPTAAYTSVATAVAAAGSGDTVQVCDGTYIEPQIAINVPLTLTSLNGPGVTFIQGNGAPGYVVNANSSGVTIERLDISNSAYVGAGEAGLIVTGSGANAVGITIRDNVLHDPRTGPNPTCDNNGGVLGIALNDVEDVTIDNNNIFNMVNPCVPAGGSSTFRSRARAIFVRGRPGTGGGRIEITNNEIDNVQGNRAGGINLIISADDFLISGNQISNLVDTQVTFGSFGIEADGGIDGTATVNEITGNSVNSADLAVRLAETTINVEVTGNTYTNISTLNGTIGPNNSTGNDMCGNNDDPGATYNVSDAGITGNTFPGGAAFAGNNDCPAAVPALGRIGSAMLALVAASLLGWGIRRRLSVA